jgi:hypothetical protein
MSIKNMFEHGCIIELTNLNVLINWIEKNTLLKTSLVCLQDKTHKFIKLNLLKKFLVKLDNPS